MCGCDQGESGVEPSPAFPAVLGTIPVLSIPVPPGQALLAAGESELGLGRSGSMEGWHKPSSRPIQSESICGHCQ